MTHWSPWNYPYRRADPKVLNKPMFKYNNPWATRAPIRKQADQEIARAFDEYERFEEQCENCKIYLETIKFYNTIFLILIGGLVAKVILDGFAKSFNNKKN